MAPRPEKPLDPRRNRPDGASGPAQSGPSRGARSDRDADDEKEPAGLVSPPVWDELYQDLADVLGSPGLPEPEALAKYLGDAVGGSFAQEAELEAPFLFGSSGEALAGTPDDQARAFVGRLNAALADAELAPEHIAVLVAKRSDTGTHVVVQQTLRGSEVVGARFQVHLDDDGRPFGLTGRPVGDLPARDPGEPPRTRDAEAVEALRGHFGLAADTPVPSSASSSRCPAAPFGRTRGASSGGTWLPTSAHTSAPTTSR